MPVLVPDPAIRLLWTHIAAPDSEESFWRAFRELYRLVINGQDVEIIQQAIALSPEKPEQMIVMQLGWFIPRWQISPSAVLRAAVPMLELADDGQREQAEMLMQMFLANEGVWVRDHDVVDYLREHCPEPPHRFVEFLCSFAPRTALLCVDGAYPDPERHRIVIWAEHVISDAIWKHENAFLKQDSLGAAQRQLNVLKRRPEWWVRLYAAEIIRLHPWLAE